MDCNNQENEIKTPTQRKREQRERDRAAGIIEITIKIPATHKQAVLDYVSTLNHAARRTDAP